MLRRQRHQRLRHLSATIDGVIHINHGMTLRHPLTISLGILVRRTKTVESRQLHDIPSIRNIVHWLIERQVVLEHLQGQGLSLEVIITKVNIARSVPAIDGVLAIMFEAWVDEQRSTVYRVGNRGMIHICRDTQHGNQLVNLVDKNIDVLFLILMVQGIGRSLLKHVDTLLLHGGRCRMIGVDGPLQLLECCGQLLEFCGRGDSLIADGIESAQHLEHLFTVC